jgi:hypothetical protein
MVSKQELIESVYAAFNRRDIDGVFMWMHPNVDWPNGMEGGREHGFDEVRSYWTRQWGLVNPHVQPKHIEDDASGKTIVDVHQVVRDLEGNVILDQMIQHIYTIHDGRIERMDIREMDTARI